MTALNLARAQFAFTVSFHFIFPAFSIGLASYLAVLEALWLKTGKAVYDNLYRYWIKIFAIVFGMGVVSGIVMSYQFGTNWSVFSDKAGSIVGPLMAYEVLSAFFLEAGFLGVMLFGIKKVGPKLHFLATCMVALGTLLSATWILAANSWMHTPAGWMMNEAGQFVPKGSWLAIIFNPSFPYRFVHTVMGAYLTTSLAVGGVGAWHLLRDKNNAGARTMFSMAMWMAALVAPLQILAGDAQGLNTQEHQPAKVMAMEGHFDSYPAGAPLVLLGIPNEEKRRMDYSLEIPKLSSLVLAHDLNAPLAGLDTIPRRDWPPVAIIFWSFRIMVGLGTAMLCLGLCSLLARIRGKLFEWRPLLRFGVLMGPAGFVAVIAGWVTTEVGRQPFTVYHLLRTADSVSPIAAPAVTGSLIAFVIVYFTAFVSGAVYILKLMSKPPSTHESLPGATPVRTAGITPAAAVKAGGGDWMHEGLTVVWAGIIVFAVAMYVVMDGFDLGIAILFTRFKVGAERDMAMNSIAPVWDGNETWLVLGGGGLMAAFPLAYAIILPALYAPMIAMLLGLVFRGVAFEFRWRDPGHRARWDAGFCMGSIVATFAQGVTLGALLQGIKISGRAYAGGYWDWITPFSVLTGLCLVIGYALLGACWLIWKTSGPLHEAACRYARPLTLGLLAAIAAVSLYTPFLDSKYYDTWFTRPGLAALVLMPLAVAAIGLLLYRHIGKGRDFLPFALTLSLFGLSLLGLAVSMWPDLIPGRLSIWDAAAPRSTQIFMLTGACVLVPLILAYTGWAYWVFRGKVGEAGYH